VTRAFEAHSHRRRKVQAAAFATRQGRAPAARRSSGHGRANSQPFDGGSIPADSSSTPRPMHAHFLVALGAPFETHNIECESSVAFSTGQQHFQARRHNLLSYAVTGNGGNPVSAHLRLPCPPRAQVRRAPLMSQLGGGLNRSTQHFILNGKDGVCGDKSKISSRFHCGRESGVVGSLAARGVAKSDWASVWKAVIVYLFPAGTARGDSQSVAAVEA
jgi:hypothetical protein